MTDYAELLRRAEDLRHGTCDLLVKQLAAALREALAERDRIEKETNALWSAAMKLADWDGGVFHYDGRIFPWPRGFVPDCPATWEEKLGPLRAELAAERAKVETLIYHVSELTEDLRAASAERDDLGLRLGLMDAIGVVTRAPPLMRIGQLQAELTAERAHVEECHRILNRMPDGDESSQAALERRIEGLLATLRKAIAQRDEANARVLAVDGEGGEGDQQLMRIARLETALTAERSKVSDLESERMTVADALAEAAALEQHLAAERAKTSVALEDVMRLERQIDAERAKVHRALSALRSTGGSGLIASYEAAQRAIAILSGETP